MSCFHVSLLAGALLFRFLTFLLLAQTKTAPRFSRRAQNNSNQKQDSKGSRRCPLVSTVDQGETGPRTRSRLPQFFFRRRWMAKCRPRPIQIELASEAKWMGKRPPQVTSGSFTVALESQRIQRHRLPYNKRKRRSVRASRPINAICWTRRQLDGVATAVTNECLNRNACVRVSPRIWADHLLRLNLFVSRKWHGRLTFVARSFFNFQTVPEGSPFQWAHSVKHSAPSTLNVRHSKMTM